MPVIWLLENFYWLQVIKLVQTNNVTTENGNNQSETVLVETYLCHQFENYHSVQQNIA